MSTSTNDSSLKVIDRDSIKQDFEQKPIPSSRFLLSRRARLFIFLLFLLLSVVVDIDNGIISSSFHSVKSELKMNDKEYGLFSSISFTGKIFGILLFMGLITSNYRKLLLAATVFLHGVSFFIYLYTNQKMKLIAVRLITAILKSFSGIFIPIWIDQFGIRNYKTMFFSFLFIVSPLGQVIGFTLGTLVFRNAWKLSFGYIGFSLICFSFVFFLIPDKFFSVKYTFIGHKKNESNSFQKYNTEKERYSLFGELKNNQIVKKKKNKAKLNHIFSLLFNGNFVFSSLSKAGFFFVFQVINSFMKDYLTNGLKIADQNKILYYYGIISISGPCLGSFVGGLLSSKVGGYESYRSAFVCLFFGTLSLLSTIPLITCTDLLYFSISLFLFNFSTAAVLPTMIGHTISSVPKEIKGFGSSIDLIIGSFFGKLPGPIVYGFLNDKYKLNDSRFAWRICIGSFIIPFLYLVIACFLKLKKHFNDHSNNNNYFFQDINESYKEESLVYKSKEKNEKQSLCLYRLHEVLQITFI